MAQPTEPGLTGFLEGPTVILRPLEVSDINARYVQWLNDPEVCRWNSHAVFPNTEAKTREYLEDVRRSASAVVLAILLRSTNQHVGNASLQRINWIDRNAEWAILIGEPSCWGKGIATEVGRLMLDYGFNRLNLHRIHLGTSVDNLGMKKVAEKLGMQQEGVRRDAMFKMGRYVDVVEYGVIQPAFRSGTPQPV